MRFITEAKIIVHFGYALTFKMHHYRTLSLMKIHLGASKGAYSKMKQDKFVIFQYSYGLCSVPIIAPFQTLPWST